MEACHSVRRLRRAAHCGFSRKPKGFVALCATGVGCSWPTAQTRSVLLPPENSGASAGVCATDHGAAPAEGHRAIAPLSFIAAKVRKITVSNLSTLAFEDKKSRRSARQTLCRQEFTWVCGGCLEHLSTGNAAWLHDLAAYVRLWYLLAAWGEKTGTARLKHSCKTF